MEHDIARAVPQPVVDPAAPDIGVPAPRPALDRAVRGIAGAARSPGRHPGAHVIASPAPWFRAGWMLTTVVTATAAWAVGWVAGVSWAWRAMTPRFVSRTRRRRVADLPGAG